MQLSSFRALLRFLFITVSTIIAAVAEDAKIGDESLIARRHGGDLSIEHPIENEVSRPYRSIVRSNSPSSAGAGDTLCLKNGAESARCSYCKNIRDSILVSTGCGRISLAKMAKHGIVFGLAKVVAGFGKCLGGYCNCGFCGARVDAASADGGGGAADDGLVQAIARATGTGAVGRRLWPRDIRFLSRHLGKRGVSLSSISLHAVQNGPKEKSTFTYCFISEAGKHKRANDPAAANKGCGCIPFTNMLWQGVIMGFKGIRSVLGRCGSSCGECLTTEIPQAGGTAGAVGGGAAAAGAAASGGAAGRRALRRTGKGFLLESSSTALAMRSNPAAKAPPEPENYTYCVTKGNAKHRRVNDAVGPTGSSGCIPIGRVAWHGILFGIGKVIEGLGKCMTGCENCCFNCVENCGSGSGNGIGVVSGGGAAASGAAASGGAAGRRDLPGDISKPIKKDDVHTSVERGLIIPPTTKKRRISEAIGKRAEISTYSYCIEDEGEKGRRAVTVVTGDDVLHDMDCRPCISYSDMLFRGILFGVGTLIKSPGGCIGLCCLPEKDKGGDGYLVTPIQDEGHLRRQT